MALKFTVHVVQSFIKGHRKSGVISIKHSRDITNRISLLYSEIMFVFYHNSLSCMFRILTLQDLAVNYLSHGCCLSCKLLDSMGL